MLSYRHAFHAGNFADVLKHVVLVNLLEGLARKPGSFFVLDTHAGAGIYSLLEGYAQKTREYEYGVARIWPTVEVPFLAGYLAAIRALNPGGALRFYPGSAWLIAQFLREGDRAACAELHPSDYPLLVSALNEFPRVTTSQTDGLAAIRALIPPREKRGLIFVDPPYERDEEWDQVIAAVKLVQQRFRQGVMAIWYPLLPGRLTERFLRRLQALAIAKTWLAEIVVRQPEAMRGMYGSGMVLINPPWGLPEALNVSLPSLAGLLAQFSGANWRSEWLVPETPTRR